MEVPELLLLISFAGFIFGIFYLFFMTRHRERMALIQKGENAGIFYPSDKTIWQTRRFIILNISLTLIGIGLGILLAIFLSNLTEKSAVFPACIFIMAGLGLLTSFLVNKRLDNH